MRKERIPEYRVEGKPLGRHIHHDPRSKNFPAATAPQVVSVLHKFHGVAMNQGNLGSCTAHALMQGLKAEPLWKAGRRLTEAIARVVYSRETVIDGFPGSYPPDDTGSDGISACKVGVERGWIKGYTHTFSLDACLKALVLQPVMIGSAWLVGMDSPDPITGVVNVSGSVRGGHEYALIGIDTGNNWVEAMNSWGRGFGLAGRFRIMIPDLGNLLANSGDCTVPVGV